MPNADATHSLVYVGTVTSRESKGIYLCRFDAVSGELKMLGLAAKLPYPTFLAIHPSGRFLYSVSEARDGGERRNGAVNAFAIEPATGELTFLNRQSSEGVGPCHVTLDRTGRRALVANYVSGSAAVLPVMDDGTLGEASDVVEHRGSSVNAERQKGPHAHSVTVSPDNRFALVADLGLDRIMIYRLDVESGRLRPNNPPWAAVAPGAGPRHLTFHPTLPYVYVINELASTIAGFLWDGSTGELREIQTLSTLPAGFRGANYGADTHVAPSGRFLYGSNRGHDSIAVFRVGQTDGRLTPVGHAPTPGKWPRNFAVHPSGRWLLTANAGEGEGAGSRRKRVDSNDESVAVFRLDQETGLLAPGHTAVGLSVPVCVEFVRG